jgi:hypothetical protein
MRHVMETSIVLYMHHRMPAHDLLALLRSFAWQSPTLTTYFVEYDREQAEARGEPELLSGADMRLLAA